MEERQRWYERLDSRLVMTLGSDSTAFPWRPTSGATNVRLSSPLTWGPNTFLFNSFQKTQLTGTHCCSVVSFSRAERRVRNAASWPSFMIQRSK